MSNDSDSNKHSNRGRGRDRSRGENKSSDLQRAISQLEEAVQDVVRSTTEDLTGRATEMLDETTRLLRGAADDKSTNGPSWGERVERKLDELKVPSRKLQRDPYNVRIAGVCAGFARYFEVETWVTRLLAVTGLLFMPQLTFPAYLIAWAFMSKGGSGSVREEWVEQARGDHRSVAPEFGPNRSPRRSLRQIQADLTDAELKLRRMETHVTSDQYALRRELAALDGSRP